MLKIRLQRTGRKNVPTFRIVLTDSKNSTKSGKFLEIMGHHDPRNDKGDVKADRVKYWMSQGAQLSATLHNLFITKGIIKGEKINKNPKTVIAKKEEPVAETPAPVKTEAPAVEEKVETPVEAPAEVVAETPAEETTPQA